MSNDNGEMPSRPMDAVSAQRAEEGYYDTYAYGLTKREEFAVRMAQALLSTDHKRELCPKEVASGAFVFADALLEEGEKK